MPENALTLLELNLSIREALTAAFPDSCWIIGEIGEINVNYSGHCYLELIEKGTDSDQIVAKARATIWSSTFRMLKPYFETTTGQTLTTGLKILVKGSVEYHELYGLSINIKDIDPSYTLGDLARKKLEIIKRLEYEGVINMNKELALPLVPQHIAIISSKTAAGYGDFVNHLNNNPNRFAINHTLFPAIMQGNEAESSIVNALDKIYKEHQKYDAVVIIRGGGSQSDLSCFNNYWLAYNIAQFPIPVLTGIGHERDESIADMVAHTKLKTPTAVADFIVSRISAFDFSLDELNQEFSSKVLSLLDSQKNRISNLTDQLPSLIRFRMSGISHNLEMTTQRYETSVNKLLLSHKQQLLNSLMNFRSSTLKLLLHKNQVLEKTDSSLQFIIKPYFERQNHRLEMAE
ncbi:MAG: exodeoxyribonuclease VII large subunit, partial [Bacteroidota bacterium]|nr:exodeoxyribonuclease VII large subunit [Bacteroidota bacterium]